MTKEEVMLKISKLVDDGIEFEEIATALKFLEGERRRKRESYKKNHVPSERPPGRPRKNPIPLNVISA